GQASLTINNVAVRIQSDGTNYHTIYISPVGNNAQNLVYASPNGASGAPRMRALVQADLPSGTPTAAVSPIQTQTSAGVTSTIFAASILNSAYGGNGNGTTDNSSAFTADCSANGEVYLPAGTFAITASSYTITCPVVFGSGATINFTQATVMNYCPVEAPPIQLFSFSG